MTQPVDSIAYAKLAQSSYDDPKLHLKVRMALRAKRLMPTGLQVSCKVFRQAVIG
jgi:hypothetical protein